MREVLFYKRGVSVLELIISLFLVTILASLVYYSLSGFKAREFLENDSKQISSLLEEARSLTISGQGGSQYGVYFQADRAVRFTGTTYATSSSGNVTYMLDSAVTISSISLSGGGTSVVFDKFTGKTSNNGNIQLTVLAATTTKRIIYINSTGIIDMQ